MKKSIKKIIIAIIVIFIVALLVGQVISALSIKGAMNDAARGSFRNEFLSFLDEVALAAKEDYEKGVINFENESHCYTIDDLETYDFKDGLGGSALVEYKANRYIITGWLYNDSYMISAKDDLLTADDVLQRGNVEYFNNCGQ